MKKRPSKLDDLVQAARAEAPVVSFEESALHIASLVEKRRKPLWMWLADAWAFPLQKLQSLRLPNAALIPQQSVFARNAIARGAFVRGFAGACTVMLVLGIFPSLIHDLRFEQLRFVQPASPKNNSANIAPVQHSASFLSAGASISTQPINSAISAIAACTEAGFMPSKSRELTHTNIPPDSSKPASPSAMSPESALALSAGTGTAHQSADTIQSNAAIVFAPENSIISALRQTTPQSSGTLRNGSSQQSSLVVKPQLEAQSLVLREKSTITAEESTKQTLPPDAVQEPSFWQHLTLEARMAARTDLTSPLPSTLLAATESQASTPLQNLALGVYYALSEHHSLGIEGGNEPFLTAVRFNSSGSLTAMTDTTNRGFNTSLAPNTKPADVLPARADQYRQGSANRTWFGAAYQYNADVWDALGGVQPLARITLGGGELGAVGRTLVGARFMAKERFSILFAGEGAAVASQIQGAWNLTPRLGVTLGLSVKL